MTVAISRYLPIMRPCFFGRFAAKFGDSAKEGRDNKYPTKKEVRI